MILAVVILLILVVGIICYILTRRVNSFVECTKRSQWLWDIGLRESAGIVDPHFPHFYDWRMDVMLRQ